jgi:molybdate transport system substrate-binding protein
MKLLWSRTFACLLAGLLSGNTWSAEATIAVAANFRQVALQIADAIEAETPHRYRIVAGSTGALYAQIRNGAPFDVFLAADLARPEWLYGEGVTTSEGVLTYATGRLAIWMPDVDAPVTAETLLAPNVRRVAIANPQLAPYGAAAESYLEGLGLMEKLRSRIVMAGNVSATYSLVASGNAEIGLIATSTLREAGVEEDAFTLVPASAHRPIEQGAVLLKRAADNAAARYWFEWLKSSDVVPLLKAAGYQVPEALAAE